jgi:predicted small lipoprotein YifL
MKCLTLGPRLALLTMVAALAGCGGSSDGPSSVPEASAAVSKDQRTILATVEALQVASRKGDGKGVCADLFTPALVKSVEAAAKRSCAKEVRQRLFSRDAAISVSRNIEVAGDRGTAIVREQNGNVSKLSMIKHHARWRIDSVTAQNAG